MARTKRAAGLQFAQLIAQKAQWTRRQRRPFVWADAIAVGRWLRFGDDRCRAFAAACVRAIDLQFNGNPRATPLGSPRPPEPR